MNIDFPYDVDARGRTATTTHADHVRDLIEQLLFTSPGERVNRPDFGAGLLDLVFAPNSPEVAATLQTTAQAALEHYLGDLITIEALSVTAEDATLRVELAYLLNSTGERRSEAIEGSVA
jgi:phage baseplate assembly protein W